MNITTNPAFYSTRQQVDTPELQTLAHDLIQCAEDNILLSNYGLKTNRYHFHIINSRDIAVTVKLSEYNNISVRGKMCNKLDYLFELIESIKD